MRGIGSPSWEPPARFAHLLRIRSTRRQYAYFEFEASTMVGMSDAAALKPEQLAAYFALMEVGNLLQHAVEQQLREEGGLSYVQFQILAVLGEAAEGRQRMTD